MIKQITILAIMALALTACAGAGVRSKSQLTVGEIVEARMNKIDLTKNRLFCTGKKKDMMDRVEGVTVKGVLCDEAEHISFLYLFNDEPFFFAIMEVNKERDELKPLLGYGALERRGLLLPVDLTSKPRLPVWAYNRDGTLIKSIYKDSLTVEPEGLYRVQ